MNSKPAFWNGGEMPEDAAGKFIAEYLIRFPGSVKEQVGEAFESVQIVSILEQELAYWKAVASGDYVAAARTKPTTFLEDVIEHDSQSETEGESK